MNQIFLLTDGNPNLFPSWALAADEYRKFVYQIQMKRLKKKVGLK